MVDNFCRNNNGMKEYSSLVWKQFVKDFLALKQEVMVDVYNVKLTNFGQIIGLWRTLLLNVLEVIQNFYELTDVKGLIISNLRLFAAQVQGITWDIIFVVTKQWFQKNKNDFIVNGNNESPKALRRIVFEQAKCIWEVWSKGS